MIETISIQDYVAGHTQRGECRCGKCIDVGTRPDPIGHTVDMVFFKVSVANDPTLEDFVRLTHSTSGEFSECDPFDGSEHNYRKLGGWIGDQGLAMQYMALGTILGAFKLLSPAMLGLSDDMAKLMAGHGMLSVVAIERK